MSPRARLLVFAVVAVYSSVYLLHDIGVFEPTPLFCDGQEHDSSQPKRLSESGIESDTHSLFGKFDHYCPFCSGFTGDHQAVTPAFAVVFCEEIAGSVEPSLKRSPNLRTIIRAPPARR